MRDPEMKRLSAVVTKKRVTPDERKVYMLTERGKILIGPNFITGLSSRAKAAIETNTTRGIEQNVDNTVTTILDMIKGEFRNHSPITHLESTMDCHRVTSFGDTVIFGDGIDPITDGIFECVYGQPDNHVRFVNVTEEFGIEPRTGDEIRRVRQNLQGRFNLPPGMHMSNYKETKISTIVNSPNHENDIFIVLTCRASILGQSYKKSQSPRGDKNLKYLKYKSKYMTLKQK